jgi:hypothetical protein
MPNFKTLMISLLLSGFFLNCSSAQEVRWTSLPKNSKVNEETKKFESKEGNFLINIPQIPTQVRNMGSEIADKKSIDVGKQFGWRLEKTSYTVMYMGPFDNDGNDLPQDWRDMDDGTRKGIPNAGAKLISEKSISYGKFQGREFRSANANGSKSIFRIYLIDTMGYQLVGSYVDDKDEKEVLGVLDSFKLLIEK